MVRKEVVKNEVYAAEKLKEDVLKEVSNEPMEKEVSGREEGEMPKEPPAVKAGAFAVGKGSYGCSSVSGRSTPNISASCRDMFLERSICSTFSAAACSPQSLSQRASPPPRQ